MRILIDLQACQGESRFRGIGHYSFSLAQSMAKLGKERGHDIWLLLNSLYDSKDLSDKFLQWIPREHIVEFGIDDNMLLEDIRLQVINKIHPDIIHITEPFGGYLDDVVVSISNTSKDIYTATTLYDFIPFIHPDLYLIDENYRKFYLERLDTIKQSNLFLAISEHSKNEGINVLNLIPEQVSNISAAVDSQFKKNNYSEEEQFELLKKYNIKQSFVLYVPGGFDPRKNFDRLLIAYSKLSLDIRNKHQVVIGSKVSDEIKIDILNKANSYGIDSDSIVLTGYLDENELIALYNLCKLYVFPSLHEGFGLPVLEAMACGAPVIGSNTTSIPEVIGYEDALFDPYSVESIYIKMHKCLTDKNFENTLRKHSEEHAKKFSWDNSAIKALDKFEEFYKEIKKEI
ncbi:MAG: glycosyltransferase [Sulfurovum sp.]|nr:glycosyltransferase [Sulfurovum sp.]